MGPLESLVSLCLRAINDCEAAATAEKCNCTSCWCQKRWNINSHGKIVSPAANKFAWMRPAFNLRSRSLPFSRLSVFNLPHRCVQTCAQSSPQNDFPSIIRYEVVPSRSRTTMNGRIASQSSLLHNVFHVLLQTDGESCYFHSPAVLRSLLRGEFQDHNINGESFKATRGALPLFQWNMLNCDVVGLNYLEVR